MNTATRSRLLTITLIASLALNAAAAAHTGARWMKHAGSSPAERRIEMLLGNLPEDARTQVRAKLSAQDAQLKQLTLQLREERRALVGDLKADSVDAGALKQRVEHMRSLAGARAAVVQTAVVDTLATLPREERLEFLQNLKAQKMEKSKE